jgi:hypothetical protein
MLEMPGSLGSAGFYQNGQEIANFFTKHSEQPDMSPDGWQSLSPEASAENADAPPNIAGFRCFCCVNVERLEFPPHFQQGIHA